MAFEGTNTVVFLASALLISAFSVVIYRLYFHPLSHIPGPPLACITSLWLYTKTYLGTEASSIDRLHQKYGPVVRIAPNEVDFSDGAALAPIYTEKGGFLKAESYRNFDIEGHPSIFSALDPVHRKSRAKAVVGMFASSSIRERIGIIEECVVRMVDRMQAEASTGKAVNVLNLTRSLAVDAVSAYLFGKSYNGIAEESGSQLSASEFVNTFVAVGRFFYLPNWAFILLESWSAKLNKDKSEVDKSMAAINSFAEKLVEEARPEDPTYQGRMLKAGISEHETVAQCLDVMFAGTDSTGMNLATACWHLAQNPKQYERLRQEVLSADPSTDPQTLPYLSAVLRETLRLSFANPTRLPRAVPAGGWTFKGIYIPPSTVVGLSPYTLHLNPAVFPSPEKFLPERWEDPTPEMNRDHIPFGLGPRQCIARNLAMAELALGVREIAKRDALRGARTRGKVVLLEWFNSKVEGEKIELVWS